MVRTGLCVIIACFVALACGSPKRLFKTDTSATEVLGKNLEDYNDEELIKELEGLLQNLNDEQLDRLQNIVDQEADEAEGQKETSEFDVISTELLEMGMDIEDVADLKLLGNLMHEFLVQVPDIDDKLKMSHKGDLQDHIQLYLLGLPNKLGPLGYIALHHVLEEDETDEEHVSVKEKVVPVKEKAAAVPEKVSPVTYRRRREAPPKGSLPKGNSYFKPPLHSKQVKTKVNKY